MRKMFIGIFILASVTSFAAAMPVVEVGQNVKMNTLKKLEIYKKIGKVNLN